MIAFPLVFESSTSTSSGMASNWSTRSGELESAVSIPPEFEGPGGGLSPEDLFNHALTNCFVATFKVYAEKSKLEFNELQVTSKLTVDLDEDRKPVMRDFYLKARILGPSNAAKALLLAKKAAASGFILNSIKTRTQFEFHVDED